jgi:hypothetical protein
MRAGGPTSAARERGIAIHIVLLGPSAAASQARFDARTSSR